jgi:multiple sugar transport system permease protein
MGDVRSLRLTGSAEGPSIAVTRTAKQRKLVLKEYASAYGFLGLWLIGVLTFFLWPFAHSIYLAFTNYSFEATYDFVGFENFRTIFTDAVSLKSMSVTLRFAVMSVPLRLSFALFIAVLLNKGLSGLGIYRTIFYIPSLIGHGVAVAIMWRQMFSDQGLVSNFLHLVVGLPTRDWINNPDSALFMLVLLSVWQFGSSMLIFLAALKQVPFEMYEQAEIDGASRWRQFWRITLPLISPVVFFNLTMNIINAFRMFTQAKVITNGGPINETLMMVLHIYNNAFGFGKMGFASALSWTLLMMIAAVTAVNFLVSKYWVYYETKVD